MSEKRFFTILADDEYTLIQEKGNYLKYSEVVELLNEQQNNINELEQENADLLGDKIRSLDEFEKCTNKLKKKILEQQATINKLQEENKQLKLTLSEYGVDLKAFEVFKQKIGYYDKVIDDE